MKKITLIIAVLIISLCLIFIGCQNNNISYGSDCSDTNALNSIDNTNQHKLNQNNEHKETIKTQIKTGTYICEYENYIFYRNTNDNGSLYRYNVDDDTYIRLFNKNANPFLHSIKIFDEKVYFVTRTQTDTAPTLYRVSIDGGEAERLIENVCDDFAVTEDAIYYTGYQCPTHYGGDYQLHKYTFVDKKSDILLDLHCYKQFSLKNDKIYCLVINDEGSKYDLAYFDIATQTTVRIYTGEVDDFQYAVSANEGKVIYLNSNNIIYSYNIETQKIKEITSEFDRIAFMAAASDDLLYFTVWKNQEKKVYQYNNGVVSQYNDGQSYQNDLLEVIDNRPILMNSSNLNGNKIEGDDRLNVTIVSNPSEPQQTTNSSVESTVTNSKPSDTTESKQDNATSSKTQATQPEQTDNNVSSTAQTTPSVAEPLTSKIETPENTASDKTQEQLKPTTSLKVYSDAEVKAKIAKHSDTKVDFRYKKQENIAEKIYDIAFTDVSTADVIYKNELGDKFRYYIDTGELNYASIKSVITEKTNNSIDITDAEKIAREYVALKCNMDEYILDLSKETDQGYQFSYTRYISNYQTTDTFEIDVSFSGEISYIIDNTDIFDGIDIKKITVHENWVNEKINQILSNYSGDKPELKTDTIRISVENQKVVLRFSVLHNNNVKVCIFPIENE